MIEKLTVVNRDEPPIKWWSKPFPRRRTFNFKRGVNILWGPNGSGKSTVIKALARLTHCEQGGISTITQQSLTELLGFGFRKECTKNMQLVSDGTPVLYFDPSVQVGLVGGGAAFDWDFGTEGLLNAVDKGSTGQQAIGRFTRLLHRASPEVKCTLSGVNDVYKRRIQMAREVMAPVIEEGPRTVLLDEPDATLDWPNKLPLWKWVEQEGLISGRVQFIIATHSIFGLRLMQLSGVSVIELEKGYRKSCEEIVREAGFWSEK